MKIDSYSVIEHLRVGDIVIKPKTQEKYRIDSKGDHYFLIMNKAQGISLMAVYFPDLIRDQWQMESTEMAFRR